VGFGGGIQVDYRCHNCAVYNNTIYGNMGDGITVSTDSNNVLIRSNIILNNSGKSIQDNGSNTLMTNNLCQTALPGCSSTSDPLFVNPANYDFTLQAGSSALNLGATAIP
jgi:parallel beta-helix repeat protein